MNDYREKKTEIRKKILKLRNMMTEIEIFEKSSKIAQKISESNEFKAAKLVMCYLDFKNEVKTYELIKICQKLSKRIAFPVTQNKSDGLKYLEPYEIKYLGDTYADFENCFKTGAYGILEPEKNAAESVDPSEIDIVIVPGVAFDIKKQRIGYGGGYYDRFLLKLRGDCLKIGIAFELQITELLPSETHDIHMDVVITEERVIY